MSFEMASMPSTPDDVSSKVLRRAEIAKMSRTLQDKLAFASYKSKNGMARLSFDVVEAQVALQSPKKRRRLAGTSVVSSSSSSSSLTEDSYSIFQQSSPSSAPMFSDDICPATEPRHRSGFRLPHLDETPTVRARRTIKRGNTAGTQLGDAFDITKSDHWKPNTTFCDSSPLQHRFHPDFRTAAGPNLSFAADMPTSPTFAPSSPSPASEKNLVLPAFQRSGSPPRTPPPTRRKTHTNTHTSEGAQLLMHLASSPTPATKTTPFTKDFSQFPLSTPPRNLGDTPGGLLGSSPGFFGFSTPAGPAFNLADFCNVTPSPAQAAFGGPRTPAMNKTPGSLDPARRALDFDSLMPPSPSPAQCKGLNLDLEGKLSS